MVEGEVGVVAYKGWVDGKWCLVVSRRVYKLIRMVDELVELRVGYFCVLVGLVDVYRDLTMGVQGGKYLFRDARDLLMDIEEVFSNPGVSRYFYDRRSWLSGDDFRFCRERGLLARNKREF